jgi:O-methyltransferase
MQLVQQVKDLVREVVSRLGYQIIKGGPPLQATHDSPYGAVIPGATYSPWAADQPFVETFAAVEQDTMVDIYRCYELWALVDQTRKLAGALLEVGAWRGGSGALIATRAKLSDIDEPVFLCDTFRGIVKASPWDSFYRGGEHSDASRDQLERLVHGRLRLDNVTILDGIFPEETGAQIQHHRFRFCHIDVDVYESANHVMKWLWERLVVGGIVVYDDYGFPRTNGITKHVDEQRGLSDRLMIHNLNGHAILIKLR